MDLTFTQPAQLVTYDAEATFDPISAVLSDALRELIYTGATNSARSLQTDIGISEVGTECARQLAYKAAGTLPVNLDADPMPSIIGTGFHLHMEKIFRGLDPRRWLVETPVAYRGIRGTADLFDRRRRLLIDWKSTSKSKINRLRKDQPPMQAQVQIQIYAAAMAALGEQVDRCALAYVPRDGKLDDLWVWSAVPDQKIADQWIDRLEGIHNNIAKGDTPAGAAPTPGLLCGFCAYHAPTSTDQSRACPGRNL